MLLNTQFTQKQRVLYVSCFRYQSYCSDSCKGHANFTLNNLSSSSCNTSIRLWFAFTAEKYYCECDSHFEVNVQYLRSYAD
jgi:hypothetical protein